MGEEKREDALRYLSVLELIMFLYFLIGFIAYVTITFFDLKYFIPATVVTLLLVGLYEVITPWDHARELLLNRPRVKKTLDDSSDDIGFGTAAFGVLMLAIFGMIHYFYWSDHLGRMIQIYFGMSLFVFLGVYNVVEKHFKKKAGLPD